MRHRHFRYAAFLAALAVVCSLAPAARSADQAGTSGQRSGQQDFDWEWGSWTTRVRVLTNPLSGKPPLWSEYEGSSVVRSLLNGAANFVELSVAGTSGKIEGGSLRLYNPRSRQWSVNYVSKSNGMLTAPVFGGFDGRGNGLFVGQDTLDGRTILVRFTIVVDSKTQARFEQAYSGDGGATWETNWIATDTLRPPDSKK